MLIKCKITKIIFLILQYKPNNLKINNLFKKLYGNLKINYSNAFEIFMLCTFVIVINYGLYKSDKTISVIYVPHS